MAIGAAIGSVVGGLASGRAASSAADAQAQAAAQANETQRYIFDRSVELSEPGRQIGNNALAAMAYETGIGARPELRQYEIEERQRQLEPYSGPGAAGFNLLGGTPVYGNYTPEAQQVGQRGVQEVGGFYVGDQRFDTREDAQSWIDNQPGNFEYGGFTESPGYQFRLEQGQKALERRAAANGQTFSGATTKGFMDYNQGMASAEYGNYYNRLAGLAGVGQSAVQTQIGAGQNYANQTGANTLAAGQARASGYQGAANAFNGTINSLGSIYGAARGGYFGSNPGFGITPMGA